MLKSEKLHRPENELWKRSPWPDRHRPQQARSRFFIRLHAGAGQRVAVLLSPTYLLIHMSKNLFCCALSAMLNPAGMMLRDE